MKTRTLSFILFMLLSLQIEAQILPTPGVRPDKSVDLSHLEHPSGSTTGPFYTSRSSPWFDVTYYRLQLNVQAQPGYLRGIVTIGGQCSLLPTTTLSFDLRSSLTVDSIFINGRRAEYSHVDDAVNIVTGDTLQSGETLSIDIHYRGVPLETGFGSFLFSEHDGMPWVWSLSEPAGARDWWPCKDDPSDKADSADIIVTCDSSFKAGSQGTLLSIEYPGNGSVRYHWHERYPIAAYLISIAVTNYEEYVNYFRYSATDSMPIVNYILPEHAVAAIPQCDLVPGMLRVFSELFGTYPFITEKYGHSEFGKGGAMEHQTMTSTTSFDEDVLSHELAHQWFGDMITCRSWSDLWLNEGISQYCSALYRERLYGAMSYRDFIDAAMQQAYGAVGAIGTPDTTSVRDLFDYARVYQKGAVVLHMLRHVLGDSLFFAGMRNYANDPTLRYGTATIDDFKGAMENTAKRDLTWFFDEWIVGSGFPEYVYSWIVLTTDSTTAVEFTIDQQETADVPFFTMPVDVLFGGPDRDTTVIVMNNAPHQRFTIPLPFTPTYAVFDPGRWILQRSYDHSRFPPHTFDLEQNFPNPFNGATTITFDIIRRSPVSLDVFDLLGRKVTTVTEGIHDAGTYTAQWNAATVSSGMYFCRLTAGSFTKVIKMIVVR